MSSRAPHFLPLDAGIGFHVFSFRFGDLVCCDLCKTVKIYLTHITKILIVVYRDPHFIWEDI